ncbi:hypothetical protein AcW1_001443 [Taiwanofungus camphoratus]|nr:hypothetical protein AcW2_000025 [Antrodia cinnamomea]KAI0964675.1 hypothetical protein AcW1_001443 [Antrodia cinnamomea]
MFDDMDSDGVGLAHSDVLALLDSRPEGVAEVEDYLRWARNLGRRVGNWRVLSQASNAPADPTLEAAIVEGLTAILPLADSSWISWARTGFPQFAAMLQERDAQRELARATERLRVEAAERAALERAAQLAALSSAPSPAPSRTSSCTRRPSARAKAAASTRAAFQASSIMASISSGQVGELASSTSSGVFVGVPPTQGKDAAKAKAPPTPEALANMAKAAEHRRTHAKLWTVPQEGPLGPLTYGRLSAGTCGSEGWLP